MRIRNLANTLGSGRDGPIHAAHCWVWVFTAASWMEWRYVGCSIERFAGKVCQNTSAQIMIRCTGSTNGKPIFEYSR
jgi:hypothetical protein